MKFLKIPLIENAKYDDDPFPHTVIDNFLNEEQIPDIVKAVYNLKEENAQYKLTNPSSCEYNKFAWTTNYGPYLKELFAELNSEEFIHHLENLTGIKNLITNDLTLKGAGIHRIKNKGHLYLHTDFNSYFNGDTKLDRRINLLIYLNPDWKEEYNGHLCLYDIELEKCKRKISPVLNRCVIFNTTSKSLHGHPTPLNVPEDIARHSIAVYYYTKNTNGPLDFEGEKEHTNAIWYPNKKIA